MTPAKSPQASSPASGTPAKSPQASSPASGNPRRTLLAALLALSLAASGAAAPALEVEVRGLPPPQAAAVAAELRARLPAASGRLRLSVKGRELTARFEREGRVLVRRYPLPGTPEGVRETLLFAAENLLRDEAAELLAALRPAASAAAPSPSASTAPPAASAAASALPAPPPAESGEPAGAAAPPSPSAATSAVTAPDQPPGAAPAPAPPRAVASAPPRAAGAPPIHAHGARPWRPVDVALLTPLGTTPDARRYGFHGVLGLLYSDVGALGGVGLSGGVLRVRDQLHGVGLAGLAVVAGQVQLGAVGGAAVYVSGRGEGLLAAGLFTHAEGGLGARVAPVNHDGGAFAGAQLGVVNLGDRVTGAQVGVVNVGGRVRGAQLGLFNLADEVDAPIGLFSVSRAGRVQPVVLLQPTAVSAGVRTETRWVSSWMTLRYGRLREQGPDVAWELSLGPQWRDRAELSIGYALEDDTRGPLLRSERHTVFTRLTAVPPMLGPVGLVAGVGARRQVSGLDTPPPEAGARAEFFLGGRFF